MDGLIRQGTLTEILHRSQMVTEADVRRVLDEQARTGARMGQLFVSLGIVTQEDIDWALSSHLDIPLVKLDRKMIDPDAVKCVPAAVARSHGLMPLFRIGDEISVAMIDPLDREAVRAVEAASGCSVKVSISRGHEVQEMQELFYGSAEGQALGFESPVCPRALLASVNADPSAARCAEFLLGKFVEERWDALVGHPVEGRGLLFSRTSGVLREVGRLPGEGYGILVQRLKRLCGLEGAQAAQAGTFCFPPGDGEHRLQALFLPAAGGDCLSVTRTVLASFPASLEAFRCTGAARDAFAALASARRGLVLFCGQDEDERGRLIDLFLERADTAGRNVMAFGGRAGRGAARFPRIPADGRPGGEAAALLAAALEHDPDVVAVEDVSDGRLFVAAARASMRGKLVLAGLPFDGRADLFRHLGLLWRRHAFVPTQLNGIVSCRSVLTLCPECREEFVPSAEEAEALSFPDRPPRFFRAAGCPACHHAGYGGRGWLLDVIPFTRELLAAFESSPDGEEAVRFLERAGNGGIEAEGRALLASGGISPDEYLASFVL